MHAFTHGVLRLATSVVLATALAASLAAQKSDKSSKDGKDAKAGSDRPKLTLTARPAIAIAPARVVFTAELTGGADDNEAYYCPSVRWEWGDLSSSETASDCPPYEAGKTSIKRGFTVDHRFLDSGTFKVYFRLKHGSKEIASTYVTVKIQPGGDFR